MPPKSAKEAPLSAELSARLGELTERHAKGLHSTASPPTVEDWKDLGNECFQRSSFLTAIKCYTKAIQDIEGGDTAVLRSNRSAAYVRSSMFSGPAMAAKDAERAVALAPSWFKAYIRLGDAQRARGKLVEARAAYQEALRLDPTCAPSVQPALKELREAEFLAQLEEQEKQARRSELERDAERDVQAVCKAAADGAGGGDREDPHTNAPPDAASSERRPLEFHNAPLRFHDEEAELCATGGFRDRQAQRGLPTEDETMELIRTWRRDLVPREDAADAASSAPRAAAPLPPSSSSSASPVEQTALHAGQAYKERLLGRFRHKVATDTDLSETLRARREEEVMKGSQVDYRNAEKFRAMYAQSTNGIGLGISADAYQEHTGERQARW